MPGAKLSNQVVKLSNLNLCISYNKVLKIEKLITNAVPFQKKSTYGVYVPPSIIPGIPVHFAIDNCDFKNDTPDGKTNSMLQQKLSFKSLTISVCNSTYQSIEVPKSSK